VASALRKSHPIMKDETQKSSARGAFVDLAGRKLREQRSGTLRESVSAPVSSFARQQLSKMGWTEGTGLGKKRDGITSHVKVTKRQDSVGLGSEKSRSSGTVDHGGEWWKDSVGDTLARLSSRGDGGKKNRHTSPPPPSTGTAVLRKEFTDEELFAATGGARFGMRAGRTRNLAKWRRTESCAVVSESSNVSVTKESSDTNDDDDGGASEGCNDEKRMKTMADEEAKAKRIRKEEKTKKRKKRAEKKTKGCGSEQASEAESSEDRRESKRIKKEKKRDREE
jgi:Pin2-interacting protein X1